MKASVGFIRETFCRYNDLIFDGILPEIPFVLSGARTFLGKLEYRAVHDVWGNTVSRTDYRMKISTSFDIPETGIEDVVIHEMIHYYIAFCGIRDTSVHGAVFRRIMDDINRKYGRNVTVRHKCPSGMRSVCDGPLRTNCICVSTLSDGKRGVTVCPERKVAELGRLLPEYYSISDMKWYCSTDVFFNRYPRSRTPKIYRIEEKELENHLSDSQLLVSIPDPD